MSGPPRPEITFKTKCISRSKDSVVLDGPEVTITITPKKPDIPAYFKVDREYVDTFTAAAPHLDSGKPGSSGSGS